MNRPFVLEAPSGLHYQVHLPGAWASKSKATIEARFELYKADLLKGQDPFLRRRSCTKQEQETYRRLGKCWSRKSLYEWLRYHGCFSRTVRVESDEEAALILQVKRSRSAG